MKLFWAFIAILFLAAAAFAIWPSVSGAASKTSKPDATNTLPTPAPSAPTPTPADLLPLASVTPTPEAAPAAEPPTRDFAAAVNPAPAAEVPAPVSIPAEPTLAAAPAPETPSPADQLPEELEELIAATIKPDAEIPAPAEAPAVKVTTAEAPASPAAPAPMTVVRQADGSQLINDRFLLRGEGTREKPYEVTWDMLLSAQEVYKPRLGQKTLPDYLDIIDGKYVRIAGYIAFPLMAESPDEMLVMLNQWDGCCIGIPPTPYDAIEVRLADAAEGDTRFKVAGALTGKIAVDPYLVKDWLIGLYTMDDAVLTVEN